MRLGRYTLTEPLAHGGMGEIFVARAHGADGFQKVVALKLALPHLTRDPDYVEMFLREARIAARLDHPNIAHVSDFGSVDGERFIAMEYVEGRSLLSVLKTCAREQRMPIDVALAILIPTARALHYAHELTGPDGQPLGIVHRDVSPANVLVRSDGMVKLIDFGIAKATSQTSATRSGILKGKVGYMSPEQCNGTIVDRRSDVFNLGILLYESTTARRLFFGDNDFAVMNKIVKGRFAPPGAAVEGYPPELERIIGKCLSVDPEHRYPTAEALAEALVAFALRERLDTSPLCVARFLGDLGLAPAERIPEPGGTAPAVHVGTEPQLPTTDRAATRPDRGGPVRLLGAVIGAALVAGVAGWAVGGESPRTEVAGPTPTASDPPTVSPSAPDEGAGGARPATRTQPARGGSAMGARPATDPGPEEPRAGARPADAAPGPAAPDDGGARPRGDTHGRNKARTGRHRQPGRSPAPDRPSREELDAFIK